MKVSLIVAVANNGVIGKDNNLVWHLPKDMKFFKETTQGHHVIMGRKNFESIPHKYRPLPNRPNIIITRQANYTAPECMVVNSVEEALKIAKINGENEAFIIGGGEIYKIALERNLITKIYLTQVHHSFDGDTFFPEIGDKWVEVKRINCKKDEKHAYNYSFLTFEKIN
ncbi:MAG: diacylglycerol kinase [Flavobacteriales bacterium]|nr:diacylglycerol kinase [Flavobacteriales bacterium]|tara:strand:- start:21931 stop:22437 length:507 start_codon:yes stop_codon:yes gene_type:complete